MNITFTGKRALVTGAGKGIGYEVAKALVAGGAETFALSKTQTNLDKLKAEVPSVHTVCVDLADWSATKDVVSALGTIDLLVNNAAYFAVSSALDAPPEEFEKTMDVNVKAVINVTQVVAKAMMARGGGGAIVNVSSQASQRALRGHLLYSIAKAAIDQVTRNFALELAQATT